MTARVLLKKPVKPIIHPDRARYTGAGHILYFRPMTAREKRLSAHIHCPDCSR
jgi:hypothetical protein